LRSFFNRHYIEYFVKENRSWARWKNFFNFDRIEFVVIKSNMAVILIVGLL
jgi:hypothetical protein